VVSDLAQLVPDVLGSASRIARRNFNGDRRLVAESENARFVTVVMRGGTAHVIHELERTIEDALGVVGTVLDGGATVPGGGAAELEVARSVRNYAGGVEGRQQLAVEAFADALDVLPRTLAENAGHDPVDALVDLRNRHAGGRTTAGLDATTGGIVDMEAAGVVEPLGVKTRALESATETAVTILRIDDVIAAGDLKGGGGDGAGGPGAPGAGGMGGPGGMGGAM
jgi:chaperonin GroEL (HSP60 family)